jgi:hypothetical protein
MSLKSPVVATDLPIDTTANATAPVAPTLIESKESICTAFQSLTPLLSQYNSSRPESKGSLGLQLFSFPSGGTSDFRSGGKDNGDDFLFDLFASAWTSATKRNVNNQPNSSNLSKNTYSSFTKQNNNKNNKINNGNDSNRE